MSHKLGCYTSGDRVRDRVTGWTGTVVDDDPSWAGAHVRWDGHQVSWSLKSTLEPIDEHVAD